MLDTAIQAVRRAGRMIAERYPSTRSANLKGYRDLVTETDIAAEAAIVDTIRSRFPEHTILSEEAAGGEIGDGHTWVVDPLDGTSNYTHRVPIFAVSIGVLERGEPVIGVVYDPMRDHMFVAERGGGAELDGEPLHVGRVSRLGRALVGFDWSRGEEERGRTLACVRQVAVRCHTMRALGSAALGLAYVAAGWLDGYFHLALHPWDTAAGTLLVAEAGGRCTAFEEGPYRINSPRCLATNGLIHEELLATLRGA